MDEEQEVKDGRIVVNVQRLDLQLEAITKDEIDAVMKANA